MMIKVKLVATILVLATIQLLNSLKDFQRSVLSDIRSLSSSLSNITSTTSTANRVTETKNAAVDNTNEETTHNYLRQAQPFINTDKTSAFLNSLVDEEESSRLPSNYKEIVFTNYGWFQSDKKKSLQHSRSLVSNDLVNAIMKDHRYNETAWDYLQRNPDSNRPIIAFLDIETCGEINWPYLGGDPMIASDTSNGRVFLDHNSIITDVCDTVQKALQSPAISASKESHLVIFSCGVPAPGNDAIFPECAYGNRNPQLYDKLMVAHLSAHKDQVHKTNDIGIPPLPIKAITLNEKELHNLQTCDLSDRKYFFSFEGRTRNPFPEFHQYFQSIHNLKEENQQNKGLVHVQFHMQHYQNSTFTNSWGGKILIPARATQKQSKDNYYHVLRNSIFAGAPRGDNLFSYRFSEILSAGSIPVIYADGYVLPYDNTIFLNNSYYSSWEDIAVFIPQKNVNQTMDILNSYTQEQICKMQKNAFHFYNEYVKDSTGRLRGIMKVLDTRRMDTGYESHILAAPE